MAPKRSLFSPWALRRRDFLLGATAVAGVPRHAFSQSIASGGKPLIVVFAEGGWDVTFCFDPKLDVGDTIDGPEAHPDTGGTETIESFGNITVQLNEIERPSVRPFFELWHPWAHVINGVWTGSIAHDPCRYRLLTGHPDGRHPDLASITGYEHGAALPLGAVDLSGWSIAGSLASSTGRVGDQNQIVALIDDALPTNQEFAQPPSFPWDYPLSSLGTSDATTIEAFVTARAERLRGRFGDQGHNDKLIDDLADSIDRGARFRDNAAGILGDGESALQLGRRSTFLDQIAIGVDLIEKDLCHSVTIDTRLDWDSHELNINQHTYYDQLFYGLDGLMKTLEAKGMLDKVVVAVISEMTRTPKLNNAGGKDHWAHTSAMLMGAVKGNATSGGTDELLESLTVNLETGEILDEDDEDAALNKYDNFVAGVLELCGVDPAKYLPGVVPFRGAHPV